MRRPSSHRAAAVLAALAVTALSGYGAVAHAGGRHRDPPKPPDEALVTSVWRGLGPLERTEALRQMNPEDAAKLADFLDRLGRGEGVPVAKDGQIIGEVDAGVLARTRMPRSKADLAPVRDRYGRIVAYWGGPLGLLDRATVAIPLLDLGRVAAKRGLNPDGTVVEDLIRQVPVAPVEVLPPLPTITAPVPSSTAPGTKPDGHREPQPASPPVEVPGTR